MSEEYNRSEYVAYLIHEVGYREGAAENLADSVEDRHGMDVWPITVDEEVDYP